MRVPGTPLDTQLSQSGLTWEAQAARVVLFGAVMRLPPLSLLRRSMAMSSRQAPLPPSTVISATPANNQLQDVALVDDPRVLFAAESQKYFGETQISSPR